MNSSELTGDGNFADPGVLGATLNNLMFRTTQFWPPDTWRINAG